MTGASFGQLVGTSFTITPVNYSVNNLKYDANGNILSMNQYGLKANGSSTVIDQLTYTYQAGNTSNKLAKVADPTSTASEHLGDFQNGGNTGEDYTYDANGNMTSDQNKKISQITYNILNLPSVITVTGKGAIRYYYDATGSKLRKRTTDNTGSTGKVTVTTYLDNAVYQNDTLQFFGMGEGRVRPNIAKTDWVYDYFLKDHLGNTRMVITDDYNVASPILEANSYYPFGLQQKGIGLETVGNLVNRHRFFGKELQEKEFSDGSGLDWYDYGMREYDQQIGRFFRIDPIGEKFQYLSPYQFSSNDPINNVDLDGAEGFTQIAYNKLVQNTIKNPNGASAKILGAVTGVGGAVSGTIHGLANTIKHPIMAVKGLVHMLSQSPSQNALNYGMNFYSQYGNSGSETFTEYAMGAHMLTDIGIALSPLKQGGLAKEGVLTNNVFEGVTSISDIGKTGEALTKGMLEGQFKGAQILDQVGIKMNGASMIADFVVVQDGKVIGIFESKVNGSKLSNGQKLFFNDGDAGTLSGKNVPEALKGTSVDPLKLQTGTYRWDSKTGSFTLQ